MSTSRGSPLLRQRWPDGSDGHCESLLSRDPLFFFRGPFSPLVTHTASRPPHLRDPRLSQRTSLLSCALPLPHRSPPYPPRFPRCARLFQPRCARLIHRRLGVRFPFRRVSPRCARLFQPLCARVIHRRLGVRFPLGNAARLFAYPYRNCLAFIYFA